MKLFVLGFYVLSLFSLEFEIEEREKIELKKIIFINGRCTTHVLYVCVCVR